MKKNRKEAVYRADNIRIKGARTHNLKNINVEIPRNQLVVVTGVWTSQMLILSKACRRLLL